MNTHKISRRLSSAVLLAAALLALAAAPGRAQQPAKPAAAAAKRPMTFMDIMGMRAAGGQAVSPDGKWMLYSVTAVDWKAGKRFSDLHLVSTERGVESSRQMTYTKDKDESSPRWSRDGRFFVFLSNRDAPATAATQNQLYLMRPDGGEARKLTDAKDGVANFAFSRDGRWLAYAAGKEEERQIWLLPAASVETAAPVALKHATPVSSWQFSYDGRRILFLAPDEFDKFNRERKEKKFDVRVRNEETPILHLWSVEPETKQERRHTSGTDYSVSDIAVSRDGKWIGFRGTPPDRYMRTVNEAGIYGDLYLLNTATGGIERLTTNKEIGESGLRFSPDGSMMAFSAANDFAFARDSRIYVRPTAQAGGQWRKLGEEFDGSPSVGFWSKDGKTIYFNEGLGATNQLASMSVETGKVTLLTDERASLFVAQDEDTDAVLITYTDPQSPPNVYTVASLERIRDRKNWRRLTDANPQAANFALGEVEAVRWKSTDGRMVEGVLIKPVGYERGKRYPLVVQIHGGPAAADTLGFSASHGNYPHVYAAAGYVLLQPNYRGSTNYGEKFRMETAGDYFRQGYDDIMSGVDHLIATGLVDPDKMGVMGWSAGGHYSNWILTHTNRFKAISSGAGAMNWISMYAQNDTQRFREWYFKGQPYDNFDHYWEMSPLKFIKNAKTPTLIHVVDGDPRVPRPQSEELHMALKKLGVPTELFVYPGATHGITEPRNQLVKMVAEFNWMEKWIKGKPAWFDWKDVLATLEEKGAAEKKPEEKKAETPGEPKDPDN